MRRFIFILLFLTLPLTASAALAARYSAFIYEPSTGKVLHAVNPDRRSYPASLTKMMTLYLVFEALRNGRLKPDQKLTVSRRAAGRAPSRLGLKRGQTIMVRDVISAMITKSANDATTVIAEELAGTEVRFARRMTAKARKIGMTRTTFRNASGLPNRRQISTARDMARLGRALARDFPKYFKHFSLQKFFYRGRRYSNHNRLLARYKGVDGIKTGYTRASGFNLVVSVKRHGRHLIGVVFGGKSARWRDARMTRLLNRAFTNLTEGDEPPLEAVIAQSESEILVGPNIEAGSRAAKKSSKSHNRIKARKKSKISSRARSRATAARRTARERARRSNNWGIQLGAFERYAPAHLAATRAARAVPGLLRTRISILPGRRKGGRIFRSLLVDMTERKARRACQRLKRRKLDCIVIQSGKTNSG